MKRKILNIIEQKRSASETAKLNSLRAAVLGANDGIVSIAGLLAGVIGATQDRHIVLLTGIAGTVAAAISMAAGEYVSVATQRDAERVKASKTKNNNTNIEFTNPWDAAISSALAFSAGASIPLLSIALSNKSLWIYTLFLSVPIALGVNGYLSSKFSGGNTAHAITRVVVGGLLAMSITYVVGSFFHVSI